VEKMNRLRTMKDAPKELPRLNKSKTSSRFKTFFLMKTQSRLWQKLDSNFVHALFSKISNMEQVKTTVEYSRASIPLNLMTGDLK